ncbi:MAG: KH domain-containing protein [Patescibacteria group bacterium]|nr:KH domain-containing protein [Patescibacteria group bacterium]
MPKNTQVVEKIIQDLLKKMNIKTDASVLLENEIIKINLDSQDSALLIGYRGTNLAALQHVVNIIWQINARKDNFKEEDIFKVVIDVGSYKSQRLDSIKKLASDMAQKVLKTGQPEVLPVMSSYERRAVHTILSELKEIMTESVGEDPYRRIIVKIRK